MRLLFLSDAASVALCFVLWAIFQLSAVFLCLKIPAGFFLPNTFPYRTYHWENNGNLYHKIFKVHKWKRFLPDGGALVKGGFRKKKVSLDPDGLSRYLTESCRGELTHWLAILPFWIFGFFLPGPLIWLMLAYAIAVNLPCIIVLRYNRPRVSSLLSRRIRYHSSKTG